jgi:hypothetical protein
MNCDNINTAEEILTAFQRCGNAGEEIELFETLAWRDEPPVEAFVEIVRKIKLETVLALAIQAFGNIKNPDIKENLKKSDDLLAMLCEQAKSGATDLIRWSAATAIENVGFGFISVSQYLTEEPSGIIQRIVQSKVKVLMDAERNRSSIKENSDYDSFIRFWVYGATYELRAATVNRMGGNAATVVNAVVQAQATWGIKQTNSFFLVLENQDKVPLQESIKQIYENRLFESEGQCLCSCLLRQNQKSTDIEIIVSNQIHCLQSNVVEVRKNAALILLSLNYRILDVIKRQNTALSALLTILGQDEDDFGCRDNFQYQKIIQAIGSLKVAGQYMSRDNACKYCSKMHDKLSGFIEYRQVEMDSVESEIARVKKSIRYLLNKIKTEFGEQLYNEYCNIGSDLIAKAVISDDECLDILRRHKSMLDYNKNSLVKVVERENERKFAEKANATKAKEALERQRAESQVIKSEFRKSLSLAISCFVLMSGLLFMAGYGFAVPYLIVIIGVFLAAMYL